MQVPFKFYNNLTLLLILIVGFVLRFWHFLEIPFTHDEFSTLFRTHFNSFSDLIEKGVKVDGHPAGVQVFIYYWTKLFGYSEPVVKLPFLVVGSLAIFVLYLIGKEWFNETVALLSASFLASIQYSIMYSQMARPYAPGLFFSLLMVYFWTKLVFKPEKKFVRNALMYILSAALCAYIHYFCLLFAITVGFSGLFFIKRSHLLKYISTGIAIFLLFAPHLKIFFYQLSMGGIGDWLGKPHSDFIINYLGYIFQFSIFTILLVLFISFFGFYKFRLKEVGTKFMLLSTIWFLIPIILGYLYSTFINSVLQYSVLIFSFPFLFFTLFGHLKPQKPLINLGLALTVLLTNSLALVYQRQHYLLFYNSPYQGILNDYQNFKNTKSKALTIIDNHPGISKYYILKDRIDTSFVFYTSFKGEKGLIYYLSENYKNADKLFFGGLSNTNPLLIPIIQDYFPNIEWQKNYAGGTSYIFSKSKTIKEQLIEKLDFENETDLWTQLNKSKIHRFDGISENKVYWLDSTNEWSPTFSKKLSEIIKNKNNFIDISVKVYKVDSLSKAVLVSSIHSGNKEIYWNGIGFNTFFTNNTNDSDWTIVHNSIKLSDIYLNYKNLELKVYIWNQGKENLIIDELEIILRDGNPVIYGLNERY